MKKRMLLSVAICISMVSFAGTAEYYQQMGKTLSEYAKCQSVSDFQQLANKFSVIANVEKEEWLPLYYYAHCHIIMSFMEPDKVKKDEYLEVANASIEKMLVLVPNEVEVYALQAFYYTGKLVVNPQERGQKYSALVGQATGRALAMDAKNPRANYLKLSNEMGTARFFGKDIAPFCVQAKALLSVWDAYPLKSSIHPKWGKQQVKELASSCPE